MRLEIVPLTLKEANDFVTEHHRHLGKVTGHRFSIGLLCEDKLVGVAIVGRPVARRLDQSRTCEITRLCTDGTYNACSKLYGAAVRAARALGFSEIVTYTRVDEPGTSLRAANFVKVGEVRPGRWSCPSRPRKEHEVIGKMKWAVTLKERPNTDED